MRHRGVVALAALALAGLLVWKLRGSGSEPEVASDAPVATTTSSARTPPASPTQAPALPSDPRAADPEVRPQPVPVDPSANPPSLDAPISKAAPPQKPFTREETIAKREADLKLLDDTRVRLEGELATARAAGDATAAHALEIRIKRTGVLRKQRSGELDQIRSGGALPP